MPHTEVRKQLAIALRKKGRSIRDIEIELKISRSTLSGWLKNIKLTKKQQQTLTEKWNRGLVKARKIASQTHRQNKINRLQKIDTEAKSYVDQISLNDNHLELFLAGLYLGEGFKDQNRTGFCNSNPQIMRTFVELLRKLYNIDETKIRAGIYARADQNPTRLVDFWSQALNIPKEKFHKTQFDKRTISTKSYSDYHGVCAIYYYDVSIQRRIMAISNEIIGRLAQLVRAHH